MEHTTFAKKTVVLAALGALSLMAATVRAADETETEPLSTDIVIEINGDDDTSIGSTIGDDVAWNDEWLESVLEENQSFDGLTVQGNDSYDTITVTEGGSLAIDLPTDEESKKVVKFDSVGLNVTGGGAFSNSSHVTFQNGSLTVTDGAFTNKEGGVVELQGGTFTLSVTKADAADDFTNAGTIVLKDNAQMTVDSGDDDPLAVETEDALALNVGNVEIGQGATLTNQDQGYQVKKNAEGESGGEGSELGEVQTLVHFGTVTVDGGQFINAEGARSEGTALVIESVADGSEAAEINGTSVWGTLQLSQKVGEGKKLSDFVDIKENADFRVTGELIIDSFAEGGSFRLNGGSDAEFFADGIDISAGSHVAADALQQVSDGAGLTWKTDPDFEPAVGTLTITGFTAKYTPADASEGEAETATGSDETNGSWTYKKFGDVSAVNTKLTISGARPSPEESDPYDGHGYTPSLEMSSLNLVGTSMRIAYDVDVEEQAEAIKKAIQAAWDEVKGESTETIEWTEDNLLEQIESMLEGGKYSGLQEALEGKRSEFENKLAGVLNTPLDIESTVSGSDLSIGTLTIARNEIDDDATVKIENPFASGDGSASGAGTEGTEGQAEGDESGDEGDEGEAESKPVTITGSETYDVVNLKLAVSDSNLDVGTLDLQTGAITLEDSKMMVSNVKTLNGSLTLKSGYLGLNVTSSVADLMKSENEAETTADPSATLEVGSPVTIGANGQLNFGTFADDDATTAETEDHAIGFFTDTDIVFDGKNFNSDALFSHDRTDGKKGIVKVDGGTLTVKAKNLSWGVYKLFDEDTLKVQEGIEISANGSEADGIWKEAVDAMGEDAIRVEGNNEIVVGNRTIDGSGLDIGAVNLANSVVGGDRGSALDKALINHILSNGQSIEEISNTINSVTGLGAVAGLTAMAVDFGNYVADQVEHHAVTMPRQAEGWWVQPIAGKLKSDDLAVGGMKSGYSIDTFGIMGGFDRKLRNGDTIGVAASYQSGDADSEGSALPVSTDVTNYGFHLWHARELDAFRLMGMFSYSKTSGDAKMNVLGQEVTSDLGATEIAIGARADKEFKWGTVRMIPHAGVRASMIDVDDYTVEMGSDELFKVSEDKLWIFEVPVGVTFASSFEYARWNVQPYVDLTVRGRFGDTDSTFTVEGSSTSDSVKYDVTGDVIGDLRIGYMSTFKDLNLGMSYGLSAGDGGRQNHQIEATLRIDFD